MDDSNSPSSGMSGQAGYPLNDLLTMWSGMFLGPYQQKPEPVVSAPVSPPAPPPKPETDVELVALIVETILAERLKDIKSNADLVSSRHDELNSKYAELSSRHEQLGSKYAELYSKNAEINSKYADLASKYAELTTKLSEFHDQVTDDDAKIEVVKAQSLSVTAGMELKLASLIQEVESLRNAPAVQIEPVRQNIVSETRLLTFEAGLREALDRIQAVCLALGTQEDSVARIQSSVDGFAAKLSELRTGLETTSSNLSVTSDGLSKRVDDVERAASQLEKQAERVGLDAIATRFVEPAQCMEARAEIDKNIKEIRAELQLALDAFKNSMTDLVDGEVRGLKEALSGAQASGGNAQEAVVEKVAAIEKGMVELKAFMQETNESLREAYMVFFRRNLILMSDLSKPLQESLTQSLTAKYLSPIQNTKTDT